MSFRLAGLLQSRLDDRLMDEWFVDPDRNIAHDHRVAGRDLKVRAPAPVRWHAEFIDDLRAIKPECLQRRVDFSVGPAELPPYQPWRRVAIEVGEPEERIDVQRLQPR